MWEGRGVGVGDDIPVKASQGHFWVCAGPQERPPPHPPSPSIRAPSPPPPPPHPISLPRRDVSWLQGLPQTIRLFYVCSILCPPTAVRRQPPESPGFLCFAVLVHVAPYRPTASELRERFKTGVGRPVSLAGRQSGGGAVMCGSLHSIVQVLAWSLVS